MTESAVLSSEGAIATRIHRSGRRALEPDLRPMPPGWKWLPEKRRGRLGRDALVCWAVRWAAGQRVPHRRVSRLRNRDATRSGTLLEIPPVSSLLQFSAG